MATGKRIRKTDVEVVNGGSVFLFVPLSAAGREWIAENVQAESWQWMGGGLAVEARYARELAAGMLSDGLSVR